MPRQTKRVMLAAKLATRDASLSKGGLLTNCYSEPSPKGTRVIKRPGFELEGVIGVDCVGQGAINWYGRTIIIGCDTLYDQQIVGLQAQVGLANIGNGSDTVAGDTGSILATVEGSPALCTATYYRRIVLLASSPNSIDTLGPGDQDITFNSRLDSDTAIENPPFGITVSYILAHGYPVNPIVYTMWRTVQTLSGVVDLTRDYQANPDTYATSGPHPWLRGGVNTALRQSFISDYAGTFADTYHGFMGFDPPFGGFSQSIAWECYIEIVQVFEEESGDMISEVASEMTRDAYYTATGGADYASSIICG